MTIRRTLATALAATAIAAPAASAQPFDTHASTRLAAAQEQQRDLRSPDAIDAAIHPRSAPAPFSIPVSPGHPSEAGYTSPLPPAADEKPATTGDAVDWATLGLGIIGLVLFMAGVVALATRTRPTPRVSA
jgi:hypothetical protein